MGKIVLLDELTINKIAAGEVIERPASVVKEMVENSIDAGAKNITVEIKNGGISLIRITDDGSGVAEDDMEIAFERHATSKIRSAQDLQEVRTLGFRGEALASISAIANVEMVSKTPEESVGHKIVVEGGKVLKKEEIGTVTGTKITVQNLFFNTPVRYKFLKKDYTEAGYIEDVVTRIALINKGIAFKLISNDKVLLQTTGTLDTKNLIYSIYGKEIANGIKEIQDSYEDINVSGVIGIPEIARSNRTNQLFYVNGRFVRDKNLISGIEQAYKNLIPTGKYAFAILNLDINPTEVDINVHPAKLEVRFQDEQKVFKAVYYTVKHALNDSFAEKGSSNADIYENKEDINISENIGNNIEKNSIEPDKHSLDNKVDNIEEISNEKSIADKENIIEKDEKKSFGGFLKKFKKDRDDDFSVNTLLEIYKSRNLTNPELSKPIEALATDIQSEENENSGLKNEEVNKENDVITNNDIVEKSAKIGDTLVSSNTRELDFNLVEALKERTLEMDSISKIKNKETIIIPSTKQTVSAETQIIDKINVNNSHDEYVDNENNNENDDIKKEQETILNNIQEGNIEATVPSIDAVEKITSKILEMKMNKLDSTQMIDTTLVREAISEKAKITPEFADMYKKTFGLDANEIRKEKELEKQKREKINVSNEFKEAENDSLFDKNESNKDFIQYRLVGIAFDNNIIIEYKNEMYIIDEMSARERINLEIVKNNYYSDKKDSTILLLPDIVKCSFKEMSIARENRELFRNAGFNYEEFGENTLKLIEVPSMCEELNTKNLFLSILNEIGNVAVNDKSEKERKFIMAIAVNSVTKPKIKLDEKEADMLIRELLSLEDPFFNIQDKPIAIKMSKGDIEKKFARRK